MYRTDPEIRTTVGDWERGCAASQVEADERRRQAEARPRAREVVGGIAGALVVVVVLDVLRLVLS